MKHNRRAFTLIELLVVVLIIGILAAVAIPQYKVAVAKSRVATILPIIKSIADAQEVYYLENADYTNNSPSLDIDIPAECSFMGRDDIHERFSCGSDFLLTNVGGEHGQVDIDYCPSDNTSVDDCNAHKELHITFRLNHYYRSSEQGKRFCVVYHNSSLGKAVCASLGLEKYN